MAKKNALISGLVILCIALIACCIFQQRRIIRLKENHGEQIERPAGGRIAVSPTAASERPEAVVGTTAKIPSVSIEPAVPPVIPPVEISEEPQEAPPMQKLFEGVSEMMKSPEMKDAIRMQQRAVLKTTYKDLMNYLELTDEEKETFENLLIDKQMAAMEIGMNMMNNSKGSEGQSSSAKEIESLKDSYDEQIKELLGEDDYAVYQDFEETQPERMQVQQFNQALGDDQALSTEQEHELIVMMHETRTNFQYRIDMDQIKDNPMALTEEAVDRMLADSERLDRKYLEQATELLTDAQYQIFEQSLEQRRAMQSVGMKMAAKMFGRLKKDKSP